MSLDLLILACIWDVSVGEYPNAFHPVVWMGKLISFLEKIFLGMSAMKERIAGIFIALFVPMVSAGLVFALLSYAESYFLLHMIVAAFFLKASFAFSALLDAGKILRSKLQDTQLGDARFELRSLCSRDASQLSEEQLLEAGISSLAENLSDSLVAPLFYFLIGGVPLAIAYRAINTLDAMIGYKNHFKNLGWASARLDDLVNWVPARLSVGILLLAGALLRFPYAQGWRVARADHHLTPSPNGGWPMATMAGLLGVSLRKPGVYSLGASLALVQRPDLSRALEITRTAGWISFGLALLGVL